MAQGQEALSLPVSRPLLVTRRIVGPAHCGLFVVNSRPSGEWSDDDFDVLAYGAAVGRIFHAAAAPAGTP